LELLELGTWSEERKVAQSAQQTVGAGGDQFYVTHCTTADSVLNNPGYSVRAASSDDHDALDAALRHPPYELPIDMWRNLPSAEQAPRRLARVEHDGGVWAVHSAYLAKDSVGRDRSYFSHLILVPDADPAAVLRSWGADGWVKSYPQGPGAPKKIPGSARLPVGSLVSDDTLTAFLSNNPPGPLELATTVCPARLRGAVGDRRELFARVLWGLLLFAEEEEEDRRRFYIHAEPGVVALLLYGAVRLLPQSVIDGLTFSTFEPYHRNIRDYRLTEVVGTYLGPPENGKGLDADLGTTRGIALDTIVSARSAPELRRPMAELPAGLSALIELASDGEWDLLPAVRNAVGADAAGLPRAGKALVRARGLARVDAGEVDIDELLALQEDRLAAEELRTREAVVWPVVRAAAIDPRRSDVRVAFRELLSDADHFKDLWEEAVEAILKEDFRTWDARWTVLREVAPAEAKKLLTKLVASEKNEGKLARLPTDVRARLRTACGDVSLLPPRALLVPVGMGELEPLLAGPPEWAGYTAFVLMAKDDLNWLPHIPAANRVQMRTRAREYLQSAPAPALAAYVHAARPFLDNDPSFLADLFAPYSPGAARLMDRLLTATTLEPGDWMKLVETVGLVQNEWGEFLLEKDHLARLLVGLGGDGIGCGVWQGYLSALTPALISPNLVTVAGDVEAAAVHEWERVVHSQLRTAADQLTAAGVKLAQALPEGGVARLFAATNLLTWVEKPGLAERDGADEVKYACETFEIDPLHLVEMAYRTGGYDQLDPASEPQEFAPLLAMFRACFPVDPNFNTAGRAVREIIRLSRSCPARSRGALQVRLLHGCVWEGHYRALLLAEWKETLQPNALAWLSEQVNRPAKKAAPKAGSKTGPVEAEAVPVEDEAGADEVNPDEDEASGTSKKARRAEKKTHTKTKKSGCLGLFLLVVACAAIGAAVAFL
jgi:hypothetical protein